jgi:hypothetical protein
MMRERIPESPPRLPADIDAVWVAPYALKGEPPTDTPWLRLVTASGWTNVKSAPLELTTD